jgi:hypothetical protein
LNLVPRPGSLQTPFAPVLRFAQLALNRRDQALQVPLHHVVLGPALDRDQERVLLRVFDQENAKVDTHYVLRRWGGGSFSNSQ